MTIVFLWVTDSYKLKRKQIYMDLVPRVGEWVWFSGKKSMDYGDDEIKNVKGDGAGDGEFLRITEIRWSNVVDCGPLIPWVYLAGAEVAESKGMKEDCD